MAKYKCINCGRWYDEEIGCKYCRNKKLVTNNDEMDVSKDNYQNMTSKDYEVDNYLKSFDSIYVLLKGIFIVIGIILSIYILSQSNFLYLLCFIIIYVPTCIIFLYTINWKKLMLKYTYGNALNNKVLQQKIEEILKNKREK